MIVAGVGFRRSVGAGEIVALVRQALDRAALAPESLCRLATVAALSDTPAFVEAAERLSAAAAGVGGAALAEAAPQVRTTSPRALAAHGVGCVAEAAALGAAGLGAILILTRIASAQATCALALSQTCGGEGGR